MYLKLAIADSVCVVCRQLDRTDGRSRRCDECLRAGPASQPMVYLSNECYFVHSQDKGAVSQGN